jgi:hypothetical protein
MRRLAMAIVTTAAIAGMLSGCAMGVPAAPGPATEPQQDASATSDQPVDVAEFVLGRWRCDAVQQGQEFAVDVAVTDSSLSFTSDVWQGEVGTTYSLTGPLEAVTADGWTITTEQVQGPEVGESLTLRVVDGDERIWAIDLARPDAESLDGTVVYDQGGTNEDVLELTCTRA